MTGRLAGDRNRVNAGFPAGSARSRTTPIGLHEPAHVIHTAACLALARGESLATFAAATTANARRLFAL